MKFERGRKKNQFIWSFILKVIAGQSLVKTLFLIKPEKKTIRGEIRFRSSGDALGSYAPSLKQREDGRAGH